MGSTGLGCLFVAVPFGIEIGLMAHYETKVDWNIALLGGALCAGIVFIIGAVCWRLCMYFTKKYLKMNPDRQNS